MKGTILKYRWEISKEDFWGHFTIYAGITAILTFIVLAIFIDILFLIGIFGSIILAFINIGCITEYLRGWYDFHIPYGYKPPDKIRNWEKEFETQDRLTPDALEDYNENRKRY